MNATRNFLSKSKMITISPTWRATVFFVGMTLLAIHRLPAQQPVPSVLKPSAPKAVSLAPAANQSATAEEKKKILASPAWQQVIAEYEKLLASQAIYTPADIQRIGANLNAQVQAMSVADLQEYLDDW